MKSDKNFNNTDLAKLMLGSEKERNKAAKFLIQQTQSMCFKVGKQYGFSDEEIFDVFQESYHKLLVAINAEKPNKNILGYFIAIFENSLIDLIGEIKKEKFEKKQLLITDLNNYFLVEEDIFPIHIPDQDLEYLLNTSLKKLSKSSRDLIFKRYYLGMSVKEIALNMGKSYHTVDTTLYRVRKKILKNIVNGNQER